MQGTHHGSLGAADYIGRRRLEIRVRSNTTPGPKRRRRSCCQMSAFGVKRTLLLAVEMSAFDPKRTSLAGGVIQGDIRAPCRSMICLAFDMAKVTASSLLCRPNEPV